MSWYKKRQSISDGTALQMPSTLVLSSVLHVVGLAGVLLYCWELIKLAGSLELFILALFTDSSLIRQGLSEISSPGIQLSYLGWMAIALSLVYFVRYRWSWILALLSALQFAANLTFIDRTRPIWIVSCALLTAMAFDQGQLSRRPFKVIGGFCLFAVLAFVLIGLWIGKTGGEAGGYGATALDGMYFSLYLYLTGGFAYANELLTHTLVVSWVPERVLYPLFRLASELGISSAPPSQISEFFYVPYPMNVGTFLEPFLNDGGVLFALVGILIYTLGFDYAGLICLRSGRFLATYFWANLCFSALIAFFVPKIGSTPFWLFLALSLGAAAWTSLRAVAAHVPPYRFIPDRSP
jgi:hypothetical protein